MNDEQWKFTLQQCRRLFGEGGILPHLSESWCAFTTFNSLENVLNYWRCGFPDESDLLDCRTVDGGLWTQSFRYDDIAHLIIPAQFQWEIFKNREYSHGVKTQDIGALSKILTQNAIGHRLTNLVLEIKLY